MKAPIRRRRAFLSSRLCLVFLSLVVVCLPACVGSVISGWGESDAESEDEPLVDSIRRLDSAGVPDVLVPDLLVPDLLVPGLPPDVPADAPVIVPAVVFSEIMYHPVLENDFVENHEFIELHNRTGNAVSLARWTIQDQVTYTFPVGASIPPGGYLVVAKNRTALAAVSSYALDVNALQGPYAGELDNGSGTLALLDGDGATIDTMQYDDRFPWPIGADALGAAADWLAPSDLPLTAHQYKGRSLERYAFDVAGTDVANWAPSPLDGATPGKPNTVSGPPPPVVETLAAAPAAGTDPLIRATDAVRIRAGFSTRGTVANVKLEYFVDKLDRTGESITSVAMTANGGAYETAVPPLPDDSIVRYRIVGNRGSGAEVVSPRPSDPFHWHAYFVNPIITSVSPVYHLQISPANWGQLWTNIDYPWPRQARVLADGCTVRASWDARVPAVFVYQGEVYDVFARYQGSRWNRTLGRDIPSWPYPGPSTGPSPLRALAWNIAFPRYKLFEKRKKVSLNKLTQDCPGVNDGLGERLYGAAGVPAPRIKFARYYINGGYYHYVMDYEHPDDAMMKRYLAKGEQMGDLFKNEGCSCDEGPWGQGDERQLTGYCGLTALQRYEGTYARQTNDWRGGTDIKRLIDDLHAARAAGTAAMRNYFTLTFDVDRLAAYFAIRNWAAPIDDFLYNHYLYRRADGKWLIMPWDLDYEFGGDTARGFGGDTTWSKATSSFYIGTEGDPSNRSGWMNYIKDSFFRSAVYRAEYNQKLLDLDGTILSPGNVKAKVDEVMALYSLSDAQAAPAGIDCDPSAVAAAVKTFADDRHVELGKPGKLTP